MLRVILADAQLELVPPEAAGHPSVRKQANLIGKAPGRLLLDANQHQGAMKGLPEAARRGRPDIVQYSLLALMESPAHKARDVEVCIHTLHGQWIRIKPETRLPRGEARFHGVFAKVLTEGATQDKDPLVWSEGKATPAEVLSGFAKGPVVRLDPEGRAATFDELPGMAHDGELTVVVGGFAHGTFSQAWQEAVPDPVSLWSEPLCAWAVLAECAAAWRTARSRSGSTPPA